MRTKTEREREQIEVGHELGASILAVLVRSGATPRTAAGIIRQALDVTPHTVARKKQRGSWNYVDLIRIAEYTKIQPSDLVAWIEYERSLTAGTDPPLPVAPLPDLRLRSAS